MFKVNSPTSQHDQHSSCECYGRATTLPLELFCFRRPFFKSRDSIWNDLPRRFGADKYVPANLDAWVAIRTAKGYTVNCPVIYAAERRSALTTKLQAKTVAAYVGRQLVFASQPSEFVRVNQSICGCLRTKRLSAARAVARPRVAEIPGDFVAYVATKTLARYCHSNLLRYLLKAQTDIAKQTSEPAPNTQRANLTLASFDMNGIPPEKPSLGLYTATQAPVAPNKRQRTAASKSLNRDCRPTRTMPPAMMNANPDKAMMKSGAWRWPGLVDITPSATRISRPPEIMQKSAIAR